MTQSIKQCIEDSRDEDTINSLLWYALGDIEQTEEKMLRSVTSISQHVYSSQHSLLQLIREKIGEMERRYVSQPAEYKGSDANVFREGYNKALDDVLKMLEE